MLEGKKTQVNSLTNPTHRLIACTVVQHAVTAAPGPALWPRPFTCGVTCTSRECSLWQASLKGTPRNFNLVH